LEQIGFWARLWLAFILPWRVLASRALATRIAHAMRAPAEALEPASTAEPEHGPEAGLPELEPLGSESERDQTTALQLLAILQREGRLIDFLQDDVTAYSDADIGAAARVVHQGCRRSLQEYLEIEPVRATDREGDVVTLEPGFDSARNRVTGNVLGDPPYRGTLAHHGWQVKRIRLPELVPGHDARILAPAEVEIS